MSLKLEHWNQFFRAGIHTVINLKCVELKHGKYMFLSQLWMTMSDIKVSDISGPQVYSEGK